MNIQDNEHSEYVKNVYVEYVEISYSRLLILWTWTDFFDQLNFNYSWKKINFWRF